MIAEVLRGGKDAGGLIRYLFSKPGRDNDHVNPRLVASWDGAPQRWEPTLRADGRRDFTAVTHMLNEPLQRASNPVLTPFGANMLQELKTPKPVYHVAVGLARADPGRGLTADPHLSDEQFAEIVTDLMVRTGLQRDDDKGVSWVAVRHDQPGESHAHIVAVLASRAGQLVRPWDDYYKLGDGCRFWESRLGLRRTAPRDGTGQKYPKWLEDKRARTNNWPQPTRRVLAEKVRGVAGAAESVEDFMRRLRDEGLLVKERLSPRDGSITGYAVAMQRPSKDGQVEQVWFSGGKLAADLTVPKLRLRWPDGTAKQAPPPLLIDREEAWTRAVDAAREATARVGGWPADPSSASAAAWEASDFLASLSRLVPGHDGKRIRDAAVGFERAGYAALGRREPPLRMGSGLRDAARLLTVARFIPRDDMRRLLSLLAQLQVLAEAIERMRAEQGRAHQAEAARRAAEALSRTSPAVVPDEDGLSRLREFTRLQGITL